MVVKINNSSLFFTSKYVIFGVQLMCVLNKCYTYNSFYLEKNMRTPKIENCPIVAHSWTAMNIAPKVKGFGLTFSE